MNVHNSQDQKEMRWLQRFQNFKRAYKKLADAFEEDIEDLSDLEKEGVIQRFEYTFELAWNTMKNYLEYAGVELKEKSPRAVIKEAFAASLISDGQQWIDMMLLRNELSHNYDPDEFETAFEAIAETYFFVLGDIIAVLEEKSA